MCFDPWFYSCCTPQWMLTRQGTRTRSSLPRAECVQSRHPESETFATSSPVGPRQNTTDLDTDGEFSVVRELLATLFGKKNCSGTSTLEVLIGKEIPLEGLIASQCCPSRESRTRGTSRLRSTSLHNRMEWKGKRQTGLHLWGTEAGIPRSDI